MRLLDRLLPGFPAPVERVANARVDGALVQEALSRHGRFKLIARGGSMNPAIPDGALVVVEPTPFEGVRFGDVVMASYGGSWYVIHRVVGRDSSLDALRIKGDSLDGIDPPVGREAFLGRVSCYSTPRGRVDLTTGIMSWAGSVLSVLSLVSVAGSHPFLRVLSRVPGGARLARLAARVSRVPGWVAAWCLVRLSRRHVNAVSR